MQSDNDSLNQGKTVEVVEDDVEGDEPLVNKNEEKQASSKGSSNPSLKDDQWVKLSHLKQLYEEGFLTVTEYKERKSQLIDSLTGTKSATRSTQSSVSQSGGGSQRMIIRQEYVPPRKPNFEGIKPEKAIKYTFNPTTGEWKQKTIKIQMERQPFAKGGLRKAFYLKYVNPEDALQEDADPETPFESSTVTSKDEVYVAKMSNDPLESREIYLADVEMQMFAREWAKKYNKFKPPKQVEFIKAVVLELIEREGSPLTGVEKFINGPYHKHNNNFGFVSEDDRNTPQSFSHFTYEASNRTLLICDVQGVGDKYTDPQIHTINGVGFGKGNLGQRGFDKFLYTHRCNAICKYLGLPLINMKEMDTGTVPQNYTAVKHITYNNVDVIEYRITSQRPSQILTPRTPLLPPKPAEPSSGCCTLV